MAGSAIARAAGSVLRVNMKGGDTNMKYISMKWIIILAVILVIILVFGGLALLIHGGIPPHLQQMMQ